MKKIKLFLSVVLTGTLFQSAHAQNQTGTTPKSYHIAIFAPLYLDSVFSNSQISFSGSIPKFVMPAVEFVQGAHIALDTLPGNGNTVTATIYDSKSSTQPIPWLIRYQQLDNADLIIGSVKDPDYHDLAAFALQKRIPFVSATYPNDGGITDNPYVIIVNSTLKANCEAIYSYILQKHGTDKIYLVKRKGDDRVDNYFRSINYADGKPLLNIKTIMIDSTISTYSLINRIDTSRTAVIIGGNLDEDFAKNLADACYPIQKKHPLILLGMPNWSGFKSLYRKETYSDFPIRYTTPYYDDRNSEFDSLLQKRYFQLYRAHPSDMAYKGFDITWYFTNLLLNYPGEIMSHLNEENLAAFHGYNFRPVYTGRPGQSPDYYENKHLFIMEILNGDIVREW